MNQINIIFFLLCFVIFPVHGEENQKPSEHGQEFLETKFIQIDPIVNLNELETINKQITQNAIDVIILTSGHTVIYSQKMEEGYTDKYKHFYGLTISILPIAKQKDYFALTLKYYNWTTIRFDKTVKKTISKYNVLNELRFALYELFRGKKFIEQNKEVLEQENYERITSIRKSLEIEKIQSPKATTISAPHTMGQEPSPEEKKEIERFKREKKELLKQVNDTATKSQEVELNSSSKNSPESLAPNSDSTKLEKNQETKPSNSNSYSENKKAKQTKNQSPNESFSNDNTVPASLQKSSLNTSGSKFHLLSGLNSQQVQTTYIINSSTNTLYLMAGLSYLSKPPSKWPIAYHCSLNIGYPIKKENYPLSPSKDISAGLGTYRLFSFLSFGPGIHYETLNFINLPERGKNLQLISNTLVSSYAFVATEFNLYHLKTKFQFSFSKSLLAKNSFNQQMNTSASLISLHIEKISHGLQLNYLSGKISGIYSGNFKSISLFYTYLFSSTLI